jgi:hypothetical protein
MKKDQSLSHAVRHDRLICERVHDPYKAQKKLAEPTVCPQCLAAFHKGRWCWEAFPAGDAHLEICQACHRLNDDYPAGWVTIGGDFAKQHREELINLARNQEEQETTEHPLHRIMKIADTDEGLLITTTDIHLPQRIGSALKHAYHGELDFHYDEEAYQLRINWHRDE